MDAVIYDFRSFQTVRDNVRAAGLNPTPLFSQLRVAQQSGQRGNSVVAASQRLNRQFRDEIDPKGAA
jgi:hypothetical protein